MKKNKQALSLIIAISITLIMSIIAISLLEYIIPFARNTKKIENSVAAYYMADSAIENTLYSMSWKAIDWEAHIPMPSSATWYSVDMTASWKTLPPTWKWNSEFDKNYNTIFVWNPIQLEIWNNRITNFNNFKIYFKVPNTDFDNNTKEILDGWTLKIINWQLTWNWNTLNSSWSQILAQDICNSKDSCIAILLKNKKGLDINDNSSTFSNFYNNNCVSKSCILKMSILNDLVLTSWEKISYLEWKIENDHNLPLRYRIIDTTWKFYWFQKSLEVKIPQKTLNEAFDFTVFQ